MLARAEKAAEAAEEALTSLEALASESREVRGTPMRGRHVHPRCALGVSPRGCDAHDAHIHPIHPWRGERF